VLRQELLESTGLKYHSAQVQSNNLALSSKADRLLSVFSRSFRSMVSSFVSPLNAVCPNLKCVHKNEDGGSLSSSAMILGASPSSVIAVPERLSDSRTFHLAKDFQVWIFTSDFSGQSCNGGGVRPTRPSSLLTRSRTFSLAQVDL